MKFILPLIFGLTTTGFAQDTLTLEGPGNANSVDLKKAAKALQRRSAAYGHQGVTARLVYRNSRGLIEITSAPDFTGEMKKSITRLGSVAGNELSFRRVYRLTDAEREQFKPGKKSPKGTQWYPYMGEEGGPLNRFILCHKMEVGRSKDFDFSKIEQGTISNDLFQLSRPFIRLSSPLSSRLKKYAAKREDHGVEFFIDGMVPGKEWDMQFDGGRIHYWYCTRKMEDHSACKKSDHQYFRKAYWFFHFDPRYLGPILQNPMPFRLTPSK